jgi:hypothetical protein
MEMPLPLPESTSSVSEEVDTDPLEVVKTETIWKRPLEGPSARGPGPEQTVSRGERFMLDDGLPLTIGGEPVVFQGVDKHGQLLYQYTELEGAGEKKFSNPILQRAAVDAKKGGEAPIGNYLVRVISVTNDECCYIARRRNSKLPSNKR